MRERLNSLKEFLQANLYTVLAVFLIVVLTMSLIIFYVSTINPGLQSLDRLSTQLDAALKAMGSASRIQGESPQSLQAQLTQAQALLALSTNAFLTPDQASKLIDLLYKYAQASGVTIVDLQVPPTPTPLPTPIPTQTRAPTPQPSPSSAQTKSASSSIPPSPTLLPTPIQATPTRLQNVSSQAPSTLYYVRNIRVRAQGTTRQLVDFVSRFKEMTAKGILVNNFNISGNEATTAAVLSMDMALYVFSGP